MFKRLAQKIRFRERFVQPCVVDVNPDTISLVALLVAIATGYSFAQDFLLIGAALLLLSGFLDVLDGTIAKTYGATKRGDFLDHTLDRIADVAIFLGLAFHPLVPFWLGTITLVTVLLVSYLGTQAQALLEERMYSGVFGRGGRIILVSALATLAAFVSPALFYGMWVLFILAAITFLQRFARSFSALA